MSESKLLDMIERMRRELSRMPIGRAIEIGNELKVVTEYIKEHSLKQTP